MMFKYNEIVGIEKYRDCEYNCHGRVNSTGFDAVNRAKIYHVSNMNMPFQGTVSDWFTSE